MNGLRFKRLGVMSVMTVLFFLAKGLIWLAVGAATVYAVPRGDKDPVPVQSAPDAHPSPATPAPALRGR